MSCDNIVDPIDSTWILQLGAGLVAVLPCAGNADANRDGIVDILDATVILQYSAGMIGPL